MTEARVLVHTLAGTWRGNHGNAPCPVCQPERRADQRALSVREEGGHLLAFCHKSGCTFADIIRAAGLPPHALGFDPLAAKDADAKRRAYDDEQRFKAKRLWDAARPICGTKGEAYLRGRGITCPLPETLRWASDAFHGPSGRYLSAMLGLVSTGGLHRTFFDKAGNRIEGQAKMMLGPCSGGAVALSEGPGPLVACEGIETGLSLLSGLLGEPARVWAALSTSGLRALDLPADPGRLIVAADGDAPGREAAEALAERAHWKGWKVALWPAPEGKDWNDVLQGGKAA